MADKGLEGMANEASPHLRLASMRAQGAAEFDPVRWHFLESLASRSLRYGGATREVLDARLESALSQFTEGAVAQPKVSSGKGVSEKISPSPFSELMHLLAQQASDDSGDVSKDGAAAPPELKALRHHRTSWSKLRVNQQLTQAIAQAPENAGPLNSTRLILQSLALMRELSPDYLNHFMTYAETLLWLEQAESEQRPMVKPKARKTSGKAAKSAAGKGSNRPIKTNRAGD